MTKARVVAAVLMLAAVLAGGEAKAQAASSNAGWQAKVRQQLPLLGHRNWILIVDSAYPLQVSPGVEVVETGADELAVTRAVLGAVDRSIHVRPIVYTDAELPYLSVQDFAGIAGYRDELKKTLAGRVVKSLPHEEILGMIGEAGKSYKVLVLKTTMAMPYTSVFLQLDCKYLSAEQEQRLRKAMKGR
ncbi:MAG: hypothetical protein JSS95_09240 [Acidobacteria bacterium]|nr:hypothetical protein [Acidobacteriota bacterium]